MPVSDLAAQTGLTPRALRYYESGENTPSVTAALAIAQALGCTVEALMAGQTIEAVRAPGAA